MRIPRLRHIQLRPMPHVRNHQRRRVHHPRHPRQIRIIDVLRLVRHLVVIEVLPARERHRRNPIPRIVVMIRAAVVLQRMPRRVKAIIKLEWHWLARIGRLKRIAKLTRQALGANYLEIRRRSRHRPIERKIIGQPAPGHILINLGDNRIHRHRGMIGKPLGAE